MDILVLNTSFEVIKVIDDYETFIWTERYSECGDFELYLPIATGVFEYIKEGHYLSINDSDEMMIIENIQLDTAVEEEPLLFVSGRSLSSILDRRIIWDQLKFSGTFFDGIREILKKNVLVSGDRNIPNFTDATEPNTYIYGTNINYQFTGDAVYDAIVSCCLAYGVGFKVILTDNNWFAYKLYIGTDRSYDQTENPYVVFSPSFDNLLSSKYIESKKNFKTIALVAGEGEGVERKTCEVICNNGAGTGLDRREVFIDARDVSSTVANSDGTTTTLGSAEYDQLLKERGKEKLAEYSEIKTFDCSVDPETSYKLNSDYYLGDIVQVVNEYGLNTKARITEIVRTVSNTKTGVYPTFTKIE